MCVCIYIYIYIFMYRPFREVRVALGRRVARVLTRRRQRDGGAGARKGEAIATAAVTTI